jgi:hypothetical protein
MNRSYSKIRHIQESNQRLELRYLLKEQKITSADQIDLKYIYSLINTSPNKDKYALKIFEFERADCTDKLIAWLKWLYNERHIKIDKENEDTAIQAGVYQNKCFVNDAEATEMAQYIFKTFEETELVHIKPNPELEKKVEETNPKTEENPKVTNPNPEEIPAVTNPEVEKVESANPIGNAPRPRVNDTLEVFASGTENRKLGYVKIIKIQENTLMGTVSFDVETIEGFDVRFGSVLRRALGIALNRSVGGNKEFSKTNFTVEFSCKKGKKMPIKGFMEAVYIPSIYNFYMNAICDVKPGTAHGGFRGNFDIKTGKFVEDPKARAKSQQDLQQYMGGDWYYWANKQKNGPIKQNQIINLIQNGTLNINSMLWSSNGLANKQGTSTLSGNDNGWVKAGAIDVFKSEFASSPQTLQFGSGGPSSGPSGGPKGL